MLLQNVGERRGGRRKGGEQVNVSDVLAKKSERQGSNEQVLATLKRGPPTKDTFDIVDKVIAEQSTTTPSSSSNRQSQII